MKQLKTHIKIVGMVTLLFLFTGCNGKPVDAYQMVWEFNISEDFLSAGFLEDEKYVGELLTQLEKGLKDKAGEYSNTYNTYTEERNGQYFGYLEVPVTDIDDEDLQSAEGRISPLEFFIMSDVETDEWIQTDLDESYLVSAELLFSDDWFPYVSITFDKEGAILFEEITEQATGKQLAIFVYGELIAAPTIHQKIPGGQAQITGAFTIEEAQSLVEDLMDSIASPVKLIEVNEVQVSF